MKLKEKFKPFVFYIADSFNVAREKDKEKNAEQCEKIADDYAIDFSAWLFTRSDINLKNKNLNELLEIFKKEKGL